MDGRPRVLTVKDETAGAVDDSTLRKVDPAVPGQVGVSMAGVVIEFRVAVGDKVARGDILFSLSAMKMETMCSSPIDGVVTELVVDPLQQVKKDQLVVVVEAS